MNQFASTKTSSGLLKNTYEDSVSDALKKKRQKLAASRIGELPDLEEVQKEALEPKDDK